MGISLYTSRVILDILGVEDFGIYNIIGGLVVLVSIISNCMTKATQRFITFELGTGDLKQVNKAFSMSMIAHFFICIFVLLLGETIGLWLVNNELNIPSERLNAALWVYQFSLITVCISLMRSPYNASLIAYEKMAVYAYMSIIEVLLKLIIVFLLVFVSLDKLLIYGVLLLFSNLIIYYIYYYYCRKKFDACLFRFVFDKAYLKSIASYLGWNLLSSSTTAGTTQLSNIILNKFAGVTVNAAYGISMQVNSAINSFVANFQVAFTPQIVKLISQNKMNDFYHLSNTAALLSYYLLFIIAFPLFFNIDYVLNIWLVEVPDYSGIFCQLFIIYFLIDSMQAPLWIAIRATGNIKVYEIWQSIILSLNIPISIILLKAGAPVYWILIIRVFFNLVTAIIRCIHVKIQLSYPILSYIKDVVLKIFTVTFLSLLVWIFIRHFVCVDSIIDFCIFYVLSIIFISLIIYFVGISEKQRLSINIFIKNKLHAV